MTAADLNAEFDNILNNLTPAGMDDASANLAAMQATADPYPAGSASLATSLAGELQRLRFLIKQITGEAQWYIDPDTDLATVATAVSGLTTTITGVVTGYVPAGVHFPYWASSAPTGWLLEDGRTIGDGSSGGTSRANADASALFTFLWTNTTNTGEFVIQDSSGAPTTRGASAADDFAAHKRMPLPDMRGRTFVGLDNMGGSAASRVAAATAIGTVAGAETADLHHTHTTGDVTLTAAQSGLPSHTHIINDSSVAFGSGSAVQGPGSTGGANSGATGGTAASEAHNHGATGDGGSTTQAIMDPYIAGAWIIKY
ncbi:MAG: hypothetical protein LLG06_19830 [Desulfobacteraceae bacterium]|nr:hypothetical protein [Desulfobacteraceae bacterium]